jgi:hypothetical protein
MSRKIRGPLYGWLILLVALGTTVVLTVGFLPGPWHHDGDGQDCTLCKVSSQPTLLTAASVTVAPPAPHASSAPRASEQRELATELSQSSPRAPPA